MYKVLSAITISLILLLASTRAVFAVTEPSFPVCANPNSVLKVDYQEGNHGIPGDTNPYQGKDAVYTLTNGNHLQCFCPENGNGIQTNWWKVTEMSEADLESLKNSGWNFIPNGALWGLEQGPYLAKNSSYSCKSTGGGGSNSNGATGPSASAPSVLGLASTGNVEALLGSLILSLTFFGLWTTLRKNG